MTSKIEYKYVKYKMYKFEKFPKGVFSGVEFRNYCKFGNYIKFKI